MPLPAVAGTLVKDIDPATFGLADGTAITFANSGLTPVNASPVYRASVFDTGAPAVEAVKGTSGFSIPRPVQDDFTIYLAVLMTGSTATGSPAFFAGGSMVDGEAPFSTNDFAINLLQDGRIVCGTGAPDTTVFGTANIIGRTAIIAITRKKSTGVLNVYVDGVLDATLTNNTNSLSAPANLYFGWGSSTGRTGGYYARGLFYDATHSNADRAAMEAYLRAAYGDSTLRVSKATSYVVAGVPRADLAVAKGLSYGVFGPGVAGTMGVTKAILYGVLGFVQQMSVTKAIAYVVVGPADACGYDGLIVPCGDRPVFNAFEACGERPASVLDACGERPTGGSFYPAQPIERCRH